jgi:hypothetical protein
VELRRRVPAFPLCPQLGQTALVPMSVCQRARLMRSGPAQPGSTPELALCTKGLTAWRQIGAKLNTERRWGPWRAKMPRRHHTGSRSTSASPLSVGGQSTVSPTRSPTTVEADRPPPSSKGVSFLLSRTALHQECGSTPESKKTPQGKTIDPERRRTEAEMRGKTKQQSEEEGEESDDSDQNRAWFYPGKRVQQSDYVSVCGGFLASAAVLSETVSFRPSQWRREKGRGFN